jgi:hypothetical protein
MHITCFKPHGIRCLPTSCNHDKSMQLRPDKSKFLWIYLTWPFTMLCRMQRVAKGSKSRLNRLNRFRWTFPDFGVMFFTSPANEQGNYN